MASHPTNISGRGVPSMSPELNTWSSSDNTTGSGYASTSPSEEKSPQYQSMGVIRGFANMQQKVTRDGQPAKRRGPKPDSKPAQTRRQELNRQAQRTHRERKEQYIKALEGEIARLREAFAAEANNTAAQIKQQDMMLRDQRQENNILREMLAAHGIPYEGELHNRKASIMMGAHSTKGMSPSYSTAPSSGYGGRMQAPPSSAGYSTAYEQNYRNGTASASSGLSSGTTHHSHSPPAVQEQARRGASQPVSDMPGIFEKDPQLGVDFILALESTCRDHGEYLVRRSVNSPNDPDQALFSGHALMASCPPPSHIEATPAQMGGLQPTYPHQVPQVAIDALNTLLNLSQVIKAEGHVEGGQVTPIMALQSLRGHRNYGFLTRDDIMGMISSFQSKVRCYGFGAVMEDFELRDALSTVFATKPETYATVGNDITADIDEMYS